jgi:hypothetical protein
MHLTREWTDSGCGAGGFTAIRISPRDGPSLIGSTPFEIRWRIAAEQPGSGSLESSNLDVADDPGLPLMISTAAPVTLRATGEGRIYLKAGPGGQVDITAELSG